jgi:hypothetical protein
MSTSTARSICETWMNVSPWVRGMDAFSWATMTFALRAAASEASTLVPSEQKPWASGRDRFSSATSSGMIPELNRPGTSDRKTGT